MQRWSLLIGWSHRNSGMLHAAREEMMARTVSAGFNELVRTVANSASESDAMRTHAGQVQRRLEAEFGSLVDFKAIGSFGNATDVMAYSDADYLAWVPYDKCPSRSDTLLSRVRKTLKDRFPKTEVNVRTPAVAVNFGSGREKLEVVPARFSRTLEGETVYEIAAGSEGDWMETAPSNHNRYVAEQHSRLDKKLKPLIRMVKLWNFTHGLRVSSFYLEMRTTKLMEDTGTILYDVDMRSALRHLASCRLRQLQDPTGLSGYIASTPASYMDRAIGKAETCRDLAVEAGRLEQKGDVSGAFECWGKVFNGWFPQYG